VVVEDVADAPAQTMGDNVEQVRATIDSRRVKRGAPGGARLFRVLLSAASPCRDGSDVVQRRNARWRVT
jgi:hypothetical protein